MILSLLNLSISLFSDDLTKGCFRILLSVPLISLRCGWFFLRIRKDFITLAPCLMIWTFGPVGHWDTYLQKIRPYTAVSAQSSPRIDRSSENVAGLIVIAHICSRNPWSPVYFGMISSPWKMPKFRTYLHWDIYSTAYLAQDACYGRTRDACHWTRRCTNVDKRLLSPTFTYIIPLKALVVCRVGSEETSHLRFGNLQAKYTRVVTLDRLSGIDMALV